MATCAHAQDQPADERERPSTVTIRDEPTLPEVLVTPDIPRESTEEGPGLPDESFTGSGPIFTTPFRSPVATGYAAGSSTFGTVIDVPALEFPGSVESVTRDLMNDQQAVTLYDVLRDVSGVYRDDGGGGVNDKFLMRGFAIDGNGNDFRKDGFRDSSRVQRSLANVQRIEFLKGPASVLYGAAGQPSGLVNYVTKNPLDVSFREARVQLGYFDRYRATVDSTGPLLGNADLLHRVNVAWQDSGSFRDFVDLERFFISPVLLHRLDDSTTLTMKMEWLHDQRVPDRGIPYYEGSFQAVPISRFLGEPTDLSRTDDGQIGLFLDRQICSELAWRVGYVSNWSEESRYNVEPVGNKVSGTQVRRRLKDDHIVDSDHFFIGNLSGTIRSGPLEHQLVLGTELGTTIRHKYLVEGDGTKLDIFDPVYGLPQPTPTRPRANEIQNDQYGLYAQDLIELGPRLSALAGLRWDSFQGNVLDTRNGDKPFAIDESVFNPRFGVVLKPIPEIISLYAGYSQSFDPQFGVTRLGSPLVPELGEMVETGIKLDLFRQRLLVNLAGFDIRERNVLVTDPIDTDFQSQVGQVQSKGVELDVMGNVTDRWSLIANCAYIDIRIIDDTDTDLLQNRLPNVPYFGAGFWTRYDVIQDCCQILGLSTGVVYRGQRQGDIDNSYELPSYARWDGGLYYRRGRLDIALVAENLLDTFYVASGRSQVANIPGVPFNIVASTQTNY